MNSAFRARFSITQLLNYKITQFKGIHGQYSEVKQRRTQEGETHGAQEAQGREAVEAPRLSARVEETEGQEDGPRPGEAVSVTGSGKIPTSGKSGQKWGTRHFS
jgi:hypothetical protein